MEKMTFREIFERDVALQKEGHPPFMSSMTYQSIRENFATFTDEEKKRCIGCYFELDRRSSIDARQNGTPNDHRYLKYLWGTLSPKDKEKMIQHANEYELDFFWDCIADTLKNDEVRTFFQEHNISNELLVKNVLRFKSMRELTSLTTDRMKETLKVAREMGISEEEIKRNPVILTIGHEILNARKNIYEEITGKTFDMGRDAIRFLTIPDNLFERFWGEKIRVNAIKNHTKHFIKYFPKNVEFTDEQRMVRTYAMVQAIHREREKEKEEEVAKGFFEDGIDAGELERHWTKRILPKGEGVPRGKNSDEVIIGVSGDAEEEKDRVAFWTKFIEKFGKDRIFTGIEYSRKGSKKVSYLKIDVGEYTVLEPIGQVNNATYVVASQFNDFLPELSRSDVTNLGIAFTLPHETKLGRYKYDADRLLTIVESLERHQSKDGAPMTREEFLEAIARAERAGKIVKSRFADSHLLKVAAEYGALKKETREVEETQKVVKKALKNNKEEID